MKWDKTYKCICRLDQIICNSKQRWNKDKCRCECKELIDKSVCDEGYFFNSSNCDCECDKSCDIGEYLDYSLIEECTENTDVVKTNENENKNENENENKYSFSLVYIVLFSIISAKNIRIGVYFVYRKYVNHNKYDLPY